MSGCPFAFAGAGSDSDGAHSDGCECAECEYQQRPSSSMPMPMTRMDIVGGATSSDTDSLPDCCGGAGAPPKKAPLTPPPGSGARKPASKKAQAQARAKIMAREADAAGGARRTAGSIEPDALSWFREKGIKGEAEFKAKKAELQVEARRRLSALDAAAARLRELDPDMDSDDAGLSDFEDGGGSLRSIGSAARAWLADTGYAGRARAALRCAAPAAGAVAGWCAWRAAALMASTAGVAGVLLHVHWAAVCLATAAAGLLGALLMFFAAGARSRKLVLTAQLVMLTVYASATLMLVLLVLQPTELDDKLFDHICNKGAPATQPGDGGARRNAPRVCQMLPGIARAVDTAAPPLVRAMGALSAAALVLVGLGVWFANELSFMEKKGIKHRRRANRTSHAIPWDKIKVRDAAEATRAWVEKEKDA